MVGYVVDADRTERVEADPEFDPGEADASALQGLQGPLRQMKPGGRGRRRAHPTSEDRLVALRIIKVGPYVGWKRRRADLSNDLLHIACLRLVRVDLKHKFDHSFGRIGSNGGDQWTDTKYRSGPDASRRSEQRSPHVSLSTEQQQLHLPP